jgi:hypothetical protein
MARPAKSIGEKAERDLQALMKVASFAGKTRGEKFLVLSQIDGMTVARARELAGYSPSDKRPVGKDYKAAVKSVDEQRAELNGEDGFTLRDSAEYFKDVSVTCKQENPEVGIKARTKLVDMLGHNAPKEIKVSEILQIGVAVKALHKIIGSSGPDVSQIEDVEFEEVGCEQGEA